MESVYGRSALAHAYLAAAGKHFGGYYSGSTAFNADLLAHHRAMLAGLERLFGQRLTHAAMPDFTTRVLFGLFASTADSLHRQATPFDGYLETGVLYNKLEEAGPAGARVTAATERISTRFRENRDDHLVILDALLIVILGDRADRTFTEAELRSLGVDPVPPASTDYEIFEDL
jgi:hypothetical protein